MSGAAHFRHRGNVLPGAVVSACAYASTGLTPGEHRGLPSPWITFIVSAGAPVRICGSVAETDCYDPVRATAYDVVVAGLHDSAARVEQPREQSGVQLAIHPLAAPTLLGCRAGELLGPAGHGHDVLGRVAATLHDQVSSCPDPDGRLDVVQRWLRTRAEEARRPLVRSEVMHAWQLMENSGGRCRIEDVAREVALSPRQLRTLLRAETGLSPKHVARVFRFDAVIARLASGGTGLAQVATTSGYADQAHLSREFRAMAGCSPTQWLAEERRNIQDGGHLNRPD